MRRYAWELALIGVCAVWGATFVVVQDAVERVPPFLFVAVRFALAAVVLVAAGLARGLTAREARAGALIGLALFGGYALQTVGLQYTSASNAGFLTGMFVVFTPLIAAATFRTLPSAAAITGVALATAGVVLLAMPEGFRIGRGDALEVLTAVSFAAHIVLIARLGPGLHAGRLALVQIATTAALSGIWTATAERSAGSFDGGVWGAIAVTGVLATAVGFFVQTRAQQQIPPTRTAVILTAEPVFAGLFGALLANDRNGWRGLAGAALIVCGILVAELRARASERV